MATGSLFILPLPGRPARPRFESPGPRARTPEPSPPAFGRSEPARPSAGGTPPGTAVSFSTSRIPPPRNRIESPRNRVNSKHYLTRTLATGASVTVSAAAPAGPALADPPRPDPPATDVTEFQIAALRELAETGDVEAQTELGERYEDGRDVAQDYTVAVSWFRRAAEQGYAPGQAALGFMYSRGRGVVQDDAEAVQWSRRAADQGDARGQNNLGASYANGFGVAQDDRAAVEWYRRAAEQGWPLAQRNLGEMYETGRGVTRDERQAASWSSGVSTWPFALSRAFFAALGVVVAVALAAQRFVEWRRAYVACSLEISDIHGCAVAKLALEGKSVFRRNVRWACLIVSQRGTNFVELISRHGCRDVHCPNDIIELKILNDLKCGRSICIPGLCVIPIPFFYCEQLGIRDETIACSVICRRGEPWIELVRANRRFQRRVFSL